MELYLITFKPRHLEERFCDEALEALREHFASKNVMPYSLNQILFTLEGHQVPAELDNALDNWDIPGDFFTVEKIAPKDMMFNYARAAQHMAERMAQEQSDLRYIKAQLNIIRDRAERVNNRKKIFGKPQNNR